MGPILQFEIKNLKYIYTEEKLNMENLNYVKLGLVTMDEVIEVNNSVMGPVLIIADEMNWECALRLYRPVLDIEDSEYKFGILNRNGLNTNTIYKFEFNGSEYILYYFDNWFLTDNKIIEHHFEFRGETRSISEKVLGCHCKMCGNSFHGDISETGICGYCQRVIDYTALEPDNEEDFLFVETANADDGIYISKEYIDNLGTHDWSRATWLAYTGDYDYYTLFYDNLLERYILSDSCHSYIDENGEWWYTSSVDSEDFGYCEECDTYFLGECCPECGFIRDALIKCRHYNKRSYVPVTYDENDTEGFIGFELEVDDTEGDLDKTDANKCARDMFECYPNLVFEEDASLSNGFEIISQPLSFRKAYDLPLNELLSIPSSYGYASHNAGTCGLHFHISRNYLGETEKEITDNISKLQLVLKIYWNDYVIFSRRRESDLEDWAVGFEGASFEKILRKQYKHYNRYSALNLEGSKTIEFRAIRGTLNPDTFYSALDFHITLVKNIKNLSVFDLFDVKKVFYGLSERTLNYMDSRECFIDLIGGSL